MSTWNEDFLQLMKDKIAYYKRMRPIVNKQVKDVMDNEVENFLFVAADGDVVIKGMHYPESAFSEEDEVPLMFKTSEKNVVIAAWPQTKVRELLKFVEDEHSKEDWDKAWNNVLEQLVKESVEKLHTAKDIFK